MEAKVARDEEETLPPQLRPVRFVTFAMDVELLVPVVAFEWHLDR